MRDNMRRRNYIKSGGALHSGQKSKPAAAAASIINANSLVLLLLVGILFWIFLCFHIHLQLSISSSDIGNKSLAGVARLRKRFMINNNMQQDENAAATTNEDIGISACLLVNDENPRLPEWIAYHYQILPLRSLIVAVDPASRSSPAEILDRWKNIMGLDVQIWEEKKYMPYGGDGACDQSDPHVSYLL